MKSKPRTKIFKNQDKDPNIDLIMKLLSVLAAGALAVPQRLLAPGLRNRDERGNLKTFVSDDGYGLTTSYDFEANRN